MLSMRTLHGGSARLAASIAAALLSTILATGMAVGPGPSRCGPATGLQELTETGTQDRDHGEFSGTHRARTDRCQLLGSPALLCPTHAVARSAIRSLHHAGKSRWQGVMRISRKKVNPSWTPTANMRAENPHLPAYVPGGHPKNPLGKRALYLGSSLYRIHGTDAPWTIGQPVSKGCIRMHNHDVADLYRRVDIGTKVTVTWKSFS